MQLQIDEPNLLFDCPIKKWEQNEMTCKNPSCSFCCCLCRFNFVARLQFPLSLSLSSLLDCRQVALNFYSTLKQSGAKWLPLPPLPLCPLALCLGMLQQIEIEIEQKNEKKRKYKKNCKNEIKFQVALRRRCKEAWQRKSSRAICIMRLLHE